MYFAAAGCEAVLLGEVRHHQAPALQIPVSYTHLSVVVLQKGVQAHQAAHAAAADEGVLPVGQSAEVAVDEDVYKRQSYTRWWSGQS